MRYVATTLVIFGLTMVTAQWVSAASPPPPRFWSVARCQQMFRAHGYPLPTADGHRFWAGEPFCVGIGGSDACQWTSGHRSRLYSEFRVFTRARHIGSVVRTFTIATRTKNGFVGIPHVGSPRAPRGRVDFYLSPASVRLLAPTSTLARFGAIVAPISLRLTRHEEATGCIGR